MKKGLTVFILLAFSLTVMFSQQDKSKPEKALMVYEESNKNIDPWINKFKNEFKIRNINVDVAAASEAGKKDLSEYEYIIIFGSVMAFTMKEPVRGWLKSKAVLSEKVVYLFVTAGNIFLDKYLKELKEILKKKKANVADAVSAATGKLTEEQKLTLVRKFVDGIK